MNRRAEAWKLLCTVTTIVALTLLAPVADNRKLALSKTSMVSSWQDKAKVAPVTVHLMLDRIPADYAYSIFLTNTVSRFGSGRIQYDTRRINTAEKVPLANTSLSNTTCLIVSRERRAKIYRDNIAPSCLLLMTNDEFCRATNPEIEMREYYHDQSQVYMPLGPRFDMWDAFQARQGENSFSIPDSSSRGLVYNAIFSLNTANSRKLLSDVLTTQRSNGSLANYPAHVQIANKWEMGLSKEHVGPADYVGILLNSTFTLSPTGHNPECFRMFEAIEAGSIPVLVLDGEYRNHKCGDALKLYREAPMIWLDSWADWPETLETLWNNPESLNRRQKALMSWYDTFMQTTMRTFEDRLLQGRIMTQ